MCRDWNTDDCDSTEEHFEMCVNKTFQDVDNNLGSRIPSSARTLPEIGFLFHCKKNVGWGRGAAVVFGGWSEVDGTRRQVTPHTRGPASGPNTETGGAVEPFQARPGTLWSALTQFIVNLSPPLSLLPLSLFSLSLYLSHHLQWEEIPQFLLIRLDLLVWDWSVDV